MTVDDVCDWIAANATDDDMEQMYLALKARRNVLDGRKMATLRLGDRVVFDSRRYGLVRGAVEGWTGKRVSVRTPSGVLWRVSPSLIMRDMS
jgi:hypothetical protein